MTTIAIVIAGRAIKKRSKELILKKKAKNIKNDNKTKSNTEKYYILLETRRLNSTIIISHFGGTNNIFVDCTYLKDLHKRGIIKT